MMLGPINTIREAFEPRKPAASERLAAKFEAASRGNLALERRDATMGISTWFESSQDKADIAAARDVDLTVAGIAVLAVVVGAAAVAAVDWVAEAIQRDSDRREAAAQAKTAQAESDAAELLRIIRESSAR